MNPVSKKRRKKMQQQAKERAERGEPTRHPGPCEVTKFLEGVTAWEKWRADYLAGRPNAESEFHRHHVWRQKGECDEPWNVVVVSEAAHRFIHDCWGTAGELVCMVALQRAGRFEPDTVLRRIGKNPLGTLWNWIDDGVFRNERTLMSHAFDLFAAHGIWWSTTWPLPPFTASRVAYNGPETNAD